MNAKRIAVFAPASIGNLSVGFDVLGLCIKSEERGLGDEVHIEASDSDEFYIAGDYADVLPENKSDNLVLQAYQLFRTAYTPAKNNKLRISLVKNLPICSGLGSSAASVVASLLALNQYYDLPLSRSQLLKLMGHCEAGASGQVHYDNIAPSYLGGLLICSNDEQIAYTLPWPDQWRLLVAYADLDIPTAMARQILPGQYTRATLIEHSQNIAQFVHAIHSDNLRLAAHSLTDLVAEPYRKQLLPNFTSVKQTLVQKHGVLACGISGSGPTIFAIVDENTDHVAARQYLQTAYVDAASNQASSKRRGFVVEAAVDRQGARLI